MPGHNCPQAIEQAAHRVKDVWAAMNKGVEKLAVVAFVIAVILCLKWILIGLMCVGALVVGGTIGYYAVVRPRLRQRQLADAELRLRRAYAPPVGAAQQQAVDGGQHVHLHFPSEAEARRFLERGQR